MKRGGKRKKKNREKNEIEGKRKYLLNKVVSFKANLLDFEISVNLFVLTLNFLRMQLILMANLIIIFSRPI